MGFRRYNAKGRQASGRALERLTNFELIINAKAATRLDLTIPQSALLRADGMLE
jgi:ABC-type uncharacterized transport system substrate-binding protein